MGESKMTSKKKGLEVIDLDDMFEPLTIKINGEELICEMVSQGVMDELIATEEKYKSHKNVGQHMAEWLSILFKKDVKFFEQMDYRKLSKAYTVATKWMFPDAKSKDLGKNEGDEGANNTA